MSESQETEKAKKIIAKVVIAKKIHYELTFTDETKKPIVSNLFMFRDVCEVNDPEGYFSDDEKLIAYIEEFIKKDNHE